MISGVTAAMETIDRASRNVIDDGDRAAGRIAPTVAHCAWPERARSMNATTTGAISRRRRVTWKIDGACRGACPRTAPPGARRKTLVTVHAPAPGGAAPV